MLYGNESISHYSRSNVAIWMAMAFQAGVLNIGGFMACHRFVSHVTGFATFFGYELSKEDSSHAVGMLVVPLFFLLGAMVSGVLVDIRLKQHKKPKYYIAFGLIFFLILAIIIGGESGSLGIFGETVYSSADYILLILLCFICGVQNGTITTVSKSVVRTTHLTGITTDLGIGLVRLLNYQKIDEPLDNEKKATLMRLGIILFFGLGSMVGGFTFARFEFMGFVIPGLTSGALFLTMLYFQFRRKD